MITRFTILLLFLIGVFTPVQSSAQALKIGYANPERIVNELPEFKKVQTDLQKMIQDKEAEISVKRDSLASTFQRYQSIAPTLSQQQNEAEQTKLQAKNDELQELSNTVRIEVQRKQAELLQPLYAKVQEAISAVAKEANLDFVFNRNTSQGDAIILFVDEAQQTKLDITDKVIAKLTKK